VPYEGEFANKSAHSDIVRNPEVAAFLEECEFLKPPSDAEAQAMTSRYVVPPSTEGVDLGTKVIAVDGSPYEASKDDMLPSTKIGYVQIGCVLIDMARFDSLRENNSQFVDPFRVAQLQEDNRRLIFPLPSANMHWKNKGSVRDSFRAVVDAHLFSEKTRFASDDPTTSLRTTLFHLAALRPGTMGSGDPQVLVLHRCPVCGVGPVSVADIEEPQECAKCGEQVYPSDVLRLWEEVSDYQSNQVAITRFMNVVEHLLPIHYIRYLSGQSLPALAALTFFVDGPLAVFGPAAWLHASLQRYLTGVNDRLAELTLPHILMIGLQKSGQVVDHVKLIDRFLPANRIFAIDDDYRYEYILAGREPSANGFGSETYYGQDFIYKTQSGRFFVFAIPYPFASKLGDALPFVEEKVQIDRYTELARALALIEHFECDLYENAVIPTALAHRYTAISLEPGGRVLDLLTRDALRTKVL
jgi:NurA domain